MAQEFKLNLVNHQEFLNISSLELDKHFETRIINNKNNNMKKLEDLSELPENMLEIKEDRSEISLKDLIDNFYTQSLQGDYSE